MAQVHNLLVLANSRIVCFSDHWPGGDSIQKKYSFRNLERWLKRRTVVRLYPKSSSILEVHQFLFPLPQAAINFMTSPIDTLPQNTATAQKLLRP